MSIPRFPHQQHQQQRLTPVDQQQRQQQPNPQRDATERGVTTEQGALGASQQRVPPIESFPAHHYVPTHYEEEVNIDEVDDEWIRGAGYGGPGAASRSGYESDSSYLAWANRSELNGGGGGGGGVRPATNGDQSGDESDQYRAEVGSQYSLTALSPHTVTGTAAVRAQQQQQPPQQQRQPVTPRVSGEAARRRTPQQRSAAELEDLFAYVSAPDDEAEDDDEIRSIHSRATPAFYRQTQQQHQQPLLDQRQLQQQHTGSHIVQTPRSTTASTPTNSHSQPPRPQSSGLPPQHQQQRHHPPLSPAQTKPPPATSAVAAAQSDHGFNDPRLLKVLQDKISDRMALEQLLVLQDEAHSCAEMIAQEAAAFRRIVFAQAFAFDAIEVERLQKVILDELLVEYTTSNFVPEVRNALHQKIEIASTELSEIEDAVRAVEMRTEEESLTAEDALVDLLTSIRSERSILMDQLQIAEEQRRRAFHDERDKMIDKNFVLAPAGTGATSGGANRSSSSFNYGNNAKSSSVTTNGTTTSAASAAPFHTNGGSVFPATSTAPMMKASSSGAIPRDLWVSKTLPTARRVASFRQEHPAGLEGRRGSLRQGDDVHSGYLSSLQPHTKEQQQLYHDAATQQSKKFIDAAFPMPPLREDLSDIQRADAPRQIPSLAGAFSAAIDQHNTSRGPAAASSGSGGGGLRAAPAMLLDGPDDKKRSAAFYHSFLAAASPKTNNATSSSRDNAGGHHSLVSSSPIPFHHGDAGSVSGVAQSGHPSVDQVLRQLSNSLVGSGTAVRQN